MLLKSPLSPSIGFFSSTRDATALFSAKHLNIAIIFYIGIVLLSLFSLSPIYPSDSVLKVVMVLSYFLVFYFLERYVFIKKKYRLNFVFFIGAIFACGYTLILMVHVLSFFVPLSGSVALLHYHGIAKMGRINLFDGCNGSAVNSALLLFIFINLFVNSSKEMSSRLKKISLYYIVIFLIALYLSYSRISYIAFTIVGFYCAQLVWQQKKSKWVFICSVLLFFVLAYVFDTKLQNRFILSSVLPGFGSAYWERMNIWTAAWNYITSHMNIKEFIIGVGPNNFFNYIHYSTSENQYLLELIEKGILGLISYVALVCSFTYFGYRCYRSSYISHIGKGLGLALFASIFFMLLHGFLASQFRSSAPFLIVMLAAYLVRELKDANSKDYAPGKT